MEEKKKASCLGVRDGGIRRNARMSIARPVDMDIDYGVLATVVAKFVSAEERIQARRSTEGEDVGSMRSARISVARPFDLGIDPDMLAAEVAEFVAAAERQRPCLSKDVGMKRGARISVARPVDLGIEPGVLEAGVAKLVAAAERRQASQRAKMARRPARANHAAGKRVGRPHGRRRRVEVVVATKASTRSLRGSMYVNNEKL